jgi:DNA-binding NtrC family response regulator
MGRILVVDDQPETLDLLENLFRREGFAVDGVRDGGTAHEYLKRVDYDCVFTDLRLGYPYDGLEILDMVKKLRPASQVVIMTAFSSVESSVLAMKAGAYDYISKPFNREEVVLLATCAAEKAQLARRVRRLEAQVDGKAAPSTGIVGNSAAMLRLMRLVGQVARTDATVLVVGESGTGKELVAQAIHSLSPRNQQPFVAVNCGAIPENLQESEFFGHLKGAFTGATRTKTGLFEQAHGGTLFLDEVGETSLATQVKLLRFLQSGEVRKVGDNVPNRVDVRLVTATNRDLMGMIAAKQFREDLYYRLNIIAVEVPPLRERDGDVEVLARFFLERFARKTGNEVHTISDEALDALRGHSWPGNVRELENAIERAVTLARGPQIEFGDLPRLDRGIGSLDVSAGWAAQVTTGEHEIPPELSSFPPNTGRGFPGRANYAGISGGWPTVSGAALPSVHAPAPAKRLEPELEAFPTLKEVERLHIEAALRRFGGNRTRACQALGISKATLWRKLKRYEAEG